MVNSPYVKLAHESWIDTYMQFVKPVREKWKSKLICTDRRTGAV